MCDDSIKHGTTLSFFLLLMFCTIHFDLFGLLLLTIHNHLITFNWWENLERLPVDWLRYLWNMLIFNPLLTMAHWHFRMQHHKPPLLMLFRKHHSCRTFLWLLGWFVAHVNKVETQQNCLYCKHQHFSLFHESFKPLFTNCFREILQRFVKFLGNASMWEFEMHINNRIHFLSLIHA